MSAHHCPVYPCPICHPNGINYTYPAYFQQMPRGCICPPTSEQTCQSPSCPRKPLQPVSALGAP